MSLGISLVVSCALNLAISAVTRLHVRVGPVDFHHSVPAHAGLSLVALVGWSFLIQAAGVYLGGLSGGFAAAGNLLVLFTVLAISGLCLLPFILFLVGEYYHRGQRFMMSEDQLHVEKTYDQAESCERRQDWEGALAIYRRCLAEDPEDLEAWRRMAEVHLKREAVDEAIRCLQNVVLKAAEPERKATTAFRLAEILAGRKGDRGEACRLLRTLERDVAGTRFAEYARERIRALEGPGKATERD